MTGSKRPPRAQLGLFDAPDAPYVKGSDTSKAAAESFSEADLNGCKRRCLREIARRGGR